MEQALYNLYDINTTDTSRERKGGRVVYHRVYAVEKLITNLCISGLPVYLPKSGVPEGSNVGPCLLYANRLKLCKHRDRRISYAKRPG